MQITQKLNQRRKHIWTQLIWLMLLSLPVSFTLHIACPPSLSFTSMHAQKHLPKRKSDCFNFHPAPPPPKPSSLSRRFTCSFFPLLAFYVETVPLYRSSSSSPPLSSLHPVLAQTQLTGGGGAAMTQSRAVQQIPLNPSARRPRVGLFASLKLSLVLECVHLCVLWTVFVRPVPCMLIFASLILQWLFTIILLLFVPRIWKRVHRLLVLKKKNSDIHWLDWLEELISVLDINTSLFWASVLHSSILCVISLSPHINVSVFLVNQSSYKSILSFLS